MEIVLVILAFVFLIVGLLGSVVPVLPGPPLCYIGLLLLKWSGHGDFSIIFLVIWAVITIGVTVMDNILPAILTKKFGGSRKAMIGSILGLIIGMLFFAPVGLLVGPFLGAFIGEMINLRIVEKRKKNEMAKLISAETEGEAYVYNEPYVSNEQSNDDKALKAALGAFLAFIVGTGAKLIICSLMIFFAVKSLF